MDEARLIELARALVRIPSLSGAEAAVVDRILAEMRDLGFDENRRDLRTYRFCTNGAYSAGQAGVPSIGFGPAAEGDAHGVDERLAITDLLAAAAGYRSTPSLPNTE